MVSQVLGRKLERWSSDELQTALYSDTLDRVQKDEAERILRKRDLAPDRKLGAAPTMSLLGL